MILLLLACTGDACTEMCDAALVDFEGCLAENGLEWGVSVGYADADDYLNWCDTYSWELRQLGEESTCASRRTILREASCSDGAAWD